MPASTTDLPSTEATTALERSGQRPNQRSEAQPSTSTMALASVLGPGRRDPFAQYPIQQTDEVDVLVDHCTL
jgi:hypothetical protein